jgi:hypothetical protein
MGTWGVGSFENDYAADWALEFEGADLTKGLNLIRDALEFHGAGSEGIEELAEALAVAAAELVATINGHPVPPPPDLHHIEKISYAEGEAFTKEEMAAHSEAFTREFGMALAAEIGRPGEVFVFEETEVFDGNQDDDEEWTDPATDWIARTQPASDPDLTDLARRAVSRVTGPDSFLADLWEESDDQGAAWRSYLAEVAAKLAQPDETQDQPTATP